MVTITAQYEGSLHCTVRHGPSGAAIDTDAPRDNHGRGEAFSPTDMVGAALATCAMTVMAITARRDGIELAGMTAELHKGMVAEPRRRIGSLTLRISGANELVFNDVKAGEVWLCSGQSNMQWSVSASTDPDLTIAGADDPDIRLILDGPRSHRRSVPRAGTGRVAGIVAIRPARRHGLSPGGGHQ